METKYYAPELHEFHEGFEYEDGFTHAEFFPRRFSYNEAARMDRSLLLKALDNKLIRVKCLNREDIESLGWKQVGYDNFAIELKDITLMLEFNPEYKTFIYRDCYPQENYFKGTIKNKSELRKLMQQLNIQ